MKRSAAQDAHFRNYKRTQNAKLTASFAKADAPECSWWAEANGDFYIRAALELPRMQGSQFGKAHKLITAHTVNIKKVVAEDTTAELEA